jgi:hypothetical protein
MGAKFGGWGTSRRIAAATIKPDKRVILADLDALWSGGELTKWLNMVFRQSILPGPGKT